MEIGNKNWTKRWAGSYTFTSCAYWGPQYFHTLNKILGEGFKSTLFIHKKGTVSFFIEKNELDRVGTILANKTINSPKFALEMLKKLKKNTDNIMQIMETLEGQIPTKQEYQQFHKVFEQHLAYHVFMKKTVDYLPDETLTKLLPVFKDARIYSEPVYSRTESFFRALAKAISKKIGYKEESLTCLIQEELEAYLAKGILPAESMLEERHEISILLFTNKKLNIVTGKRAIKLEKSLQKKNENEIKGTIAYNGRISGRCRIIHDPFAKNDFQEGDILITGMTRPEFIPLMEKASAIVTDAGGMLCHAAITAREMKKPCIVGTERVTKTFKDGDYIEVDAYEGIIKKLPTNNTGSNF
jgi:phosphohistidine swiveling domain-containing protein